VKKEVPELVQTAQALEDDLVRFEGIVAEALRAGLESQKALERAAELLKAVVAADQRISESVNALVAAVHRARQRREERAQVVAARAQEIEARSNIYGKLMEEYRGIGQAAGEVTQKLMAVAGAPPAQREAALAVAREEVAALAERARRLAEQARDDGFQDIARQAEGLKGQLHQALNKVLLATRAN
jgi:hypothetical protein